MGSFELGVEDGLLDPCLTVRRLKYDGSAEEPFKATEIFGDEVRSVVTASALYRETAFSVFMPSEGPMLSLLTAYLGDPDTMDECDLADSIRVECPWVHARRHLSVRYHKIFLCAPFKKFEQLSPVCSYRANIL